MTIAEEVTRRLRDLLIRGELRASARLTEEKLAAILGASRTPVRTALNILGREGLVEYTPSRGYRLRSITLDEALQAFRVRGVLEGLACATLAERGLSPAAAKRIERTVLEYGQIVERDTLSEFDIFAIGELNQTFHTTILQRSGNKMLMDFVQVALRVPLASFRVIPHSELEERLKGARLSHIEHLAILAAMRARDPEQAEREMRQHVERSARMMAHLYRTAMASDDERLVERGVHRRKLGRRTRSQAQGHEQTPLEIE